MLTLKRRRKRLVPPQRGRRAISGLFFCCAQSSILAAVVSTGPVVATARSFAHACLPHRTSHLGGSRVFNATHSLGSPLTRQGIRPVARRCGRQAHSLAVHSRGVLLWSGDGIT
jgi:hypothetical protein